MSVKITARDFEDLGQRAQALIREMGVRGFAGATGLSESTARRLLRDPEAIMRGSGATAVLVILELRIRERRK